MYQKGKRAEKWESAHHCKGCPIGARNAGEAPPQPVAPSGHCAHCGNTSFKLVFDRLCVSCYNRLIEALKGRNARGQAPKKLQARHAGDLSWAKCGGHYYVAVGGHVKQLSRPTEGLPSAQCSLFDTM